jgi:hypothetical protein
LLAAVAGAAPAVLERRRQVHARRLQHRRQPDGEPGQERHRHHDDERSAVHADLFEARDVARLQRDEQRHAPQRQHQPRGSAEEREQGALGQELADQARPAGTQRRADRVLAVPRGRPCQQQMSEVGTASGANQRTLRDGSAASLRPVETNPIGPAAELGHLGYGRVRLGRPGPP